MILIGLGANLPSMAGPPRATLEAALGRLGDAGIKVVAHSRWYRTAPVPVSDQPLFVNGVAVIETALAPLPLLAALHKVEDAFGRQRSVANAARTLDLDILDYAGRVEAGADLILPHPRLQDRAFVLLPLAEVAPGWRHPILGRRVEALISTLPANQTAEALPE